METYWVWEYGLFEKNPKRQDSLNPETTLEVVKAADAQATIAALQARVRELEESRDAWRASQECSEKAYMALVNQIPAERFDYDPINVALLDGAKEQEIIGRKQIADLQAELERVRDLIKALPKVEGEIVIDRKGNGTEAGRLYAYVSTQTESYYRLHAARFTENEHAQAYAALLQHRQGMEG